MTTAGKRKATRVPRIRSEHDWSYFYYKGFEMRKCGTCGRIEGFGWVDGSGGGWAGWSEVSKGKNYETHVNG